MLQRRLGGFEPERSCKKFQGASLVRKNPAQDAPGSAQAACKPEAGCRRLEGESPLLRNGNKINITEMNPVRGKFLQWRPGDSNRSAPVKIPRR
jgi:hypothetical protein